MGRSQRAKHNQLHHQCGGEWGLWGRLLRWRIATPSSIRGHVMNQPQKSEEGQ